MSTGEQLNPGVLHIQGVLGFRTAGEEPIIYRHVKVVEMYCGETSSGRQVSCDSRSDVVLPYILLALRTPSK